MPPILVEATDATYSGPMTIPEHLFAEGSPTAEVWTSGDREAISSMKFGIWRGQPGKVNVPGYPTDEVFTVIRGRIELTNEDGSTLAVGAGQCCMVTKGWVGVWHTVEQTEKSYVTFEG